jgi:hypothetical protein
MKVKYQRQQKKVEAKHIKQVEPIGKPEIVCIIERK